MQTKRRFSLMALPQSFDGATLGLNIVVLPRNQNPLRKAIELNPPIPDAPPFAEAQLQFEAKIVSGFSNFPNSRSANVTRPLITVSPTDQVDLFTALAQQFNISNIGLPNIDLDANDDSVKKKAPAVIQARSVQKYLPLTYRKAFNFTTPRTPNATVGDGYSCAVRNAGMVPGFQRSTDAISWGKVFGYTLRQPLLAAQLGMVYTTSLAIEDTDFASGGWLFIDLADDSDYKEQQAADDTFVARYAARISPLKLDKPRPVFAPMLVPVLFKAKAADPDPTPDGNYDEVLLELSEYDDGFAKIVHAYQPKSLNLLSEESDGAHPVKDVGIRLGWDDEQILIWYMRQMMIDPTVTNPDKRLEAPLTTFGYSVDVRKVASPPGAWQSLNLVTSKAVLQVAKDKSPEPEMIPLGTFDSELPYQVYPVQLDGDTTKSYWLPMYFANWNGHSVVLPDQDAAEIYQTNHPDVKGDPITPTTGTGATGPAQNRLNDLFAPGPLSMTLQYGNSYEFRVRLRDLSGGGTPNDPQLQPVNESPSSIARCPFKRFVAPNQVRIKDLPVNSDLPSNPAEIELRRPLLGYPAVNYTQSKYADPVALLKQASIAMAGTEAFGIEDPDVDRVEITVEIQTLKMDYLLSVSGKDNYVYLYKTIRTFSAVHNESDYKKVLTVPVIYRDCAVLHVGDEVDLAGDLGLADDIDKLEEIVLPTAREIRITMRAVCEEKIHNADYYGLIDNDNPDLDTRFGRTVQMSLYEPSAHEPELFVAAAPGQMLQGIYLQPDPPALFDGNMLTFLLGKPASAVPDLIQRLAKQLQLESSGLSLVGAKGQRTQFGCSNRIRHTLSPESSSLTFSSKGDLMNHWLSCITLDLNRDWTWDGLAARSLVITRSLRFMRDNAATETEVEEIGDIEIRHTASFEALQTPQRNFTKLIFIDAIEPKNPRVQPAPNDTEPRFPDTIQVSYAIEPRYKPSHGVEPDTVALNSELPMTTPPHQIPKIASAGIALSPYKRNEKYSATDPRQRFLWIEFEEPVLDPQDTYFARVLAYAPDQLISNNHPELLAAPDEPALPIDPEFIRVIPPDAPNDLAGLNAMQPMEKSSDSDLHYLLPLPPGLHANAPEMFGFFTYEFRVGHYRIDPENMAWSTAQGRFGRPLRATGIQHPAPTLTCAVNRDQHKLYVVAPYAIAVLDGKDYTADPPRTQLWCLLYAQVRQADNKDFRNILLDDKQLDWRVQIEEEQQVNWFQLYDRQQQLLLRNITIKNWKDEISYTGAQHIFKLKELTTSNKDATTFGTVAWLNSEVEQLLENYGLPTTSALSVLVVETLPSIRSLREAVSNVENPLVSQRLNVTMAAMKAANSESVAGAALNGAAVDVEQMPSPVSDELGEHRILRSSPLTEVPYIC
ncbi:MAG TPA: hypothetical protein VK578_03470 [Edaphobacter sp.]|nr:hypothetical protein [Edaphobacter sp.]